MVYSITIPTNRKFVNQNMKERSTKHLGQNSEVKKTLAKMKKGTAVPDDVSMEVQVTMDKNGRQLINLIVHNIL